jgi:hydrogenase/urease accessory protein HupE
VETKAKPGATAVAEHWKAVVTVGIDAKLAENPKVALWNPLAFTSSQSPGPKKFCKGRPHENILLISIAILSLAASAFAHNAAASQPTCHRRNPDVSASTAHPPQPGS